MSNLIGISKDNKYVTPKTSSILPSITNKMLMQLAADKGLVVEPRQLPYEELKTFEEVGACGTATVVAPIASISDDDGKHEFGKFEILNQLRTELQAIQFGEVEDKHGWMKEVNC